MNRKNLIEIVMVIGLIITLILLIRVYNVAKTEGYKCQVNPLVYAADRYSKANGHNMVGTATFLTPNSPTVHFNRYNLTVEFASQANQNIFDVSFLENGSLLNN